MYSLEDEVHLIVGGNSGFKQLYRLFILHLMYALTSVIDLCICHQSVS